MTTMKTKEDLYWDDENSVNKGYDIKTSSFMHGGEEGTTTSIVKQV